MLNIDQPLRKFTLAVIRSIKKRLRDGRGVERDTGRLGRSLRMRQYKSNSFISGEYYAEFLRNDRDKDSKRRRSIATHWGFIEESIDKVDKKEFDKLAEGIADALMKQL